MYQNALDLWEELGGHLEERAAVTKKLGDAFYKFGIEAQRAVCYLQQALRFNEELGNHQKVATVHSQLGREYMHSGNLAIRDMAKALEHFHLAKDILDREAESVPHGMVYCGLALARTHLAGHATHRPTGEVRPVIESGILEELIDLYCDLLRRVLMAVVANPL
ncbi:MAG: hypothetical protein V3V07_09215 [candidate division NC10 bacterium]